VSHGTSLPQTHPFMHSLWLHLSPYRLYT
jgi:hypothetical protein